MEISNGLNKIKYFFSLGIFFLTLTASTIVNSPKTQAVTVLGTVDLYPGGAYGIYMYSGGCFQSDISFTSKDLACQSVYGINSKAGSNTLMALNPITAHCDSGIKGICGRESGSTCNWGTWECIEKTTPSCALTVSPDSITQGKTENITVSWTTTNAATAAINDTSVTPVASGSKVFPGVSTAATYTLAVTGDVVVPPCTASVGIFTPPVGGLVPCGRLADNPATTEINESKPCDLCSAFYMLKKMLNFAIEIAAGIAVFVIVIGGLLYAFSAGNPGNIEKAKSAITNAIMGLAIMFIAWLIVALILNAMGYADITNWNQVNCALQR